MPPHIVRAQELHNSGDELDATVISANSGGVMVSYASCGPNTEFFAPRTNRRNLSVLCMHSGEISLQACCCIAQVEVAVPGDTPTTMSALTAFLPLTFMSDPTRSAAMFAEIQLKKDAPATGNGERGA